MVLVKNVEFCAAKARKCDHALNQQKRLAFLTAIDNLAQRNSEVLMVSFVASLAALHTQVERSDSFVKN